MGEAVEGGELIQLVDLDRDFCVWQYGLDETNDPEFLHHWKMDGNVNDSQGSSNGTEIGTPSYVTGVFGQAIAVRDGDEAESNFIFDPADYPDGFAFCCYILSEANGSGGFVGDAAAVADRVGIDSTFETSASLFYGSVSAAPGSVTGGGVFHHAVINVDHLGGIRFYFDGKEIFDKSISSIPNIADNPIPAQEMLFNGTETGAASRVHIDDARFYSRPLTQKEITDFANSTAPVGCTAVLGTDGEEKCRNTFNTCQDTDNYSANPQPLKFTKPQQSIPRDDYYFPSLVSLNTTPGSLAKSSEVERSPLGQRAKLTAVFRDHPHTDRIVDKYAEERRDGTAQNSGVGYNPEDKGTFWGKEKARNLYYLGRAIRAKQGVVDPVDLTKLTTRHYIQERWEGPDSNFTFRIVAKDFLKLADDERAQAPAANTGEIADSGGISAGAGSLTLAPSGIGDAEYGTSGKIAVGREVMDYTRTAGSDTLTLTARGQNGTDAESHDQEDTVQECLVITSDTVADILLLFLVTHAGIDSTLIPHEDGSTSTEWGQETAEFMPELYSAVIAKPTPVKKLIGELARQAGFALWSDEIRRKIQLSAIKTPGIGAKVLTDDAWIIKDTLRVEDDPDSRISEVWTHFGLIDPTDDLDNDNNYRSTLVTVDPNAAGINGYDQDAIEIIHSRWIPQFGKAIADDLNDRLLERFAQMLRIFSFDMPSYRADEIQMGQSHTLRTRYIQDANGDPQDTDVRILAVEQDGDVLHVRAEELRFQGDPTDNTNTVIIDADTLDFNLRDAYDSLYSAPSASTIIECIIESNAVVGSTAQGIPGFDVGDWSGLTYNSITIKNYGRLQGAGGQGGDHDTAGQDGGTAFKTTVAITVDNQGKIYGGGGGGGGGRTVGFHGGGGGGGGAGRNPGPGGEGQKIFEVDGEDGQPGTLDAGGAGGAGGVDGKDGGAGGGIATAGTASEGGDNAGGAAGTAVDGESLITYTNVGDIQGARIN